jgi:hypothetical protein
MYFQVLFACGYHPHGDDVTDHCFAVMLLLLLLSSIMCRVTFTASSWMLTSKRRDSGCYCQATRMHVCDGA